MNRVFVLRFAVSATMVLSGCVTRHDGVSTISSSVQALAGRRMRVDASYASKSDCSFRTIPTVHILEPPKHGSFVLVQEKIVPSSVEIPSRLHIAKCKDVPVSGIAGYYTAAPNFVGSDTIQTSHSFGDGRHVFHRVINITVTKSGPKSPS